MSAALISAVTGAQQFWWEKKDSDGSEFEDRVVASHVFETLNSINISQVRLHLANVRHAKLYSNSDIRSLRGNPAGNHSHRSQNNSENIIQAIIDTATSMIAKDRPRPVFLTDGAEFSDQRKARQLEKFVGGVFKQTKIYDEMVEVFRDSCIFGTGCLKIFEEDDEIRIERVLIEDITVDEQETRTGPPQQMFQTVYVNRQVLMGMDDWDDGTLESIANASAYVEPGTYTHDPDMLRVVEAWHPSTNGENGRHVIAIEDALLLDEGWDDDFPFVFYRWTKHPVGFHGQGLAEQLAPLQLRINKLNRFIDRCQDLISNPRIFLNRLSRVNPLHITNEIGQIVEYSGNVAPTFHTTNAVGADVYAYKEQLIRKGFELAGISQFASQSVKPPGLESGAALREFHDITTGRFVIQAQRLEGVYMDSALRVVKVAQEIYSRTKDFTSVFVGRTLVEQIPWSSLDIPSIDNFVVSIEAASILSQTPAGRLQSVIELAQADLIDKDESRRLLGHPDIGRAMDLGNARIENIEATIEKLLLGEWVSPRAFQDLSLGKKMVTEALLKAHNDGAPDEVLELMGRWVETVHYMENPPATPGEQEMLASQQAGIQQQQLAAAQPPALPNQAAPQQLQAAI